VARNPGDRKIESLAAIAHQGKGDVLDVLARAPEAVKEARTAVALADRVLSADPGNLDAQYQSIGAHYALDWMICVAQPGECECDARQELPLAIRLAAAQPQNLDAQVALANIYSLIGTAGGEVSTDDGPGKDQGGGSERGASQGELSGVHVSAGPGFVRASEAVSADGPFG
jgi:hypothetical protein